MKNYTYTREATAEEIRDYEVVENEKLAFDHAKVILAGLESKTNGSIVFHKNLSIGYMLQYDCLFAWRSILDNCLIGLEITGQLNDNNKKYIYGTHKT